MNRKWYRVHLPTGIFIAGAMSGVFYFNCVGVEDGGPGFPYTIWTKYPYGGGAGNLVGLIFTLPVDVIMAAINRKHLPNTTENSSIDAYHSHVCCCLDYLDERSTS